MATLEIILRNKLDNKLSEKDSNWIKNSNDENIKKYIFVNNIKWGKKANILINCVDLGTNIEFYFSVFFSNKYFSRSGDFNFREYMENSFENNRILAVKFKRSKTGYLNCFNARIAEVSDL
ncbi:TPA: hypothetical protein R0911_001739 [Campylobacter coli]|nr:hypothetical protein [Campylobacter coli]